MITFFLAGLMQFRLTALLSQVQLFLICCVSTAAFLFFPNFLHQNALVVLSITVGTANILTILIGLPAVINGVPKITLRLNLPLGFWRFASYIHLNSVCTFAYTNIDQLMVLGALGTKELGAYFVLLQCAQFITFVPQRIGQVMLASFSHLVNNQNHSDLQRAYANLCRIILILGTPLALFMVLFSQQIALIFGEWLVEKNTYLILLSVALQIGNRSRGLPVSSMTF